MLEIDTGPAPSSFFQGVSEGYGLFLALHEARHRSPEVFTFGRCNTVLGSIFAARKPSWRVIGITKKALCAYADENFEKSAQSKAGMRRAHLFARIETTKLLLDTSLPRSVDEVAETLWQRDMTIICVRGENYSTAQGVAKLLNESFSIKNTNWDLFAGLQVGWRFGRDEQSHLQRLANSLNRL